MINSRTISGILCLGAICVPLAVAPFRITQSLAFVHNIENRTPNSFPALNSASNLIDANWWASVSRAMEDRVPYREQVTRLHQGLFARDQVELLNDQVIRGQDDWLFYYDSLANTLGSIDDTQKALSSIDQFLENSSFKADLYFVAAPDKAGIYPEMLSSHALDLFVSSKPQRELMYRWFSSPGYPERLDVWTPMHQLKASSQEIIYEPGGSHYNSLGAMVLAKAMIDAVDPTLWDSTEIAPIWTRTFTPDLAKMGGLLDYKDTVTKLQVRRDGVEITALWDNDQLYDSPEYLSIDTIEYNHTRRVTQQSSDRQLIPGKTLVVHDSFIASYLYPTISQFFEDIKFIHVGHLSPAQLRQALDQYDRVYFESVERVFAQRVNLYFDNGKK